MLNYNIEFITNNNITQLIATIMIKLFEYSVAIYLFSAIVTILGSPKNDIKSNDEMNLDKAIALSVKEKNLVALNWFIRSECPLNHQSYIEAIKNLDIKMLNYLKYHKFRLTTEVFIFLINHIKNESILYSRSHNDVKYSNAQKIKWEEYQKIVNWMFDNECPVNERLLESSVDFGFIYIAKKIIVDKICPMNPSLIKIAIRHKCAATVLMLMKNNCPLDDDIFYYAINNGSVGILNILRDSNCFESESRLDDTLVNNNSDRPNRFKIESKLDHEQISNYSLKILDWLHDNGSKFDDGFCSKMIEIGNNEAFWWATSKEYKIDKNCSASSCSTGNLQILEYLVKNKYELDESCGFLAAAGKKISILRFLKEKNLIDISNLKNQSNIFPPTSRALIETWSG